MATHSNILAWRVPGTKEPGGLQSMGLQSQTRLSDSHTHTPPWPPVAAHVPLQALSCSMASNGHLSQLKPKFLTLAHEALQDLTMSTLQLLLQCLLLHNKPPQYTHSARASVIRAGLAREGPSHGVSGAAQQGRKIQFLNGACPANWCWLVKELSWG